MNSQDCSKARRGMWENSSREGVSSGSSVVASLSSVSAAESDAEDEAAATPLGLSTSNSVVVCGDVDDEDGMAFLSGAGSGFAGTY